MFFFLMTLILVCILNLLYPCFSEVERGYTGFTLSICLSVHPPLFNNTHRIHFIYTSCQATSEGVLCAIIFFKSKQFEVLANSVNLQLWLCLVSTWAPIWIIRMGNHGAVGVSSKRRHSSCSSYYIHTTYHSCSISNWNKLFLSNFNCRVQDSLYYDMFIGIMWHCALVSCSRSQSIGLVLGCALSWYWMSFLLIPW